MPQLRRYELLPAAARRFSVRNASRSTFFSPARCSRLFRNAPLSCSHCYVALSRNLPGGLQKRTRHEGESSRSSASRAVLAGIRGYTLVLAHFMPTTVPPQRWEKAFGGSPPGMSPFSEYSQARVGKKLAAPSTLMCDTEADADADACASLALPHTSALLLQWSAV
ncbi:hypothetical protein F5883DRAFT_537117 [Diaporthe sp. PMI_573]|nr:hypothetical protein F5883DRAFT_537117 [Diaporthaceae sp. PMI_573]